MYAVMTALPSQLAKLTGLLGHAVASPLRVTFWPLEGDTISIAVQELGRKVAEK